MNPTTSPTKLAAVHCSAFVPCIVRLLRSILADIPGELYAFTMGVVTGAVLLGALVIIGALVGLPCAWLAGKPFDKDAVAVGIYVAMALTMLIAAGRALYGYLCDKWRSVSEPNAASETRRG